jgi:signal transduction histidine kinase
MYRRELQETVDQQESKNLKSSASNDIRDRIYEDLHTRVIGRLRALGTSAAATLLLQDVQEFRTALARIDPEVRDIIREIRHIVGPSWFREDLKAVSEDESQDRFQLDLWKDINEIQQTLEIEVDFQYSSKTLGLLSPQQYLPIQNILENLLYNAGLHGGASKASVYLYPDNEKVPSSLEMRFTCNGRGHEGLNDLEAFIETLPPDCTGLRTVQSAVKALNAGLKSSSSIDSGTTMIIHSIPILH